MRDQVLPRLYPNLLDRYHGEASFSPEEDALTKRKLAQAIDYERRQKALGLAESDDEAEP